MTSLMNFQNIVKKSLMSRNFNIAIRKLLDQDCHLSRFHLLDSACDPNFEETKPLRGFVCKYNEEYVL